LIIKFPGPSRIFSGGTGFWGVLRHVDMNALRSVNP